MGTGGSRIRVDAELLRRIVDAANRNPQAVSRAVGQIAGQFDATPDDVIRAVQDAAVTAGSALLALARSASAAIDSAISAGSLTAPGAAAAAGTGSASIGGGIVSWFANLGVAAQVGTVVATVVLATTVAGSFTSSPSVPAEGYQAVGMQVDGIVRIVSVRHTDAIETGIAPCNFRHGGNECASTADVVALDPGVFETPEAATEVLCRMFEGPRSAPALSDGWTVPYDGRAVTLDDWGSVDFAVCDAVIDG
jgi:hypothetical protein